MSLSIKPYKGARDFYPEDKRIQKYMFNVMRRIVQSYGYEEYDAPILEPTDLYLIKGNQEIIDDQTYTFADRGGRSVTVRTEMTPTVSRMVAAKRQELSYPLRWYSIPNLWRYERMQRGRLREFWQLNVDIFGIDNVSAEVEMIQVADAVLKAYGAKPNMYSIKLNSRVLIQYILNDYLTLDDVQATSVIRIIDKMKKMDESAFIAQLDAIFTPAQRESGRVDQLLELLKVSVVEELPESIAQHESAVRLHELVELLKSLQIPNIAFDMSLMRGFDYYTDVVFEVFDTHPDNNRSMFGGGRYDGLVGQFGVESIPTVGFGMGDVTLLNFLEIHELLPNLSPETDAYVVLIGDTYSRAASLLTELRMQGLNLAVDTTGRKLDKQIKAAVKKSLRYAIIIGENELTSEEFILKDLHTGIEEKHGKDRLISIVKDYRHHEDVTDLE